ncbi:methyl-accepting chemotaxis protein [Devosia sp. LjRoot3]|uniref:methyl-accepting chemotaxis protein n=1 Tax=Devosia sp. LjRoot3 TaxID=3342319 RepID=UPI003ECC5D45
MFRFSRFSITKKLVIVFLGFGVVVAALGGLALLAAKSLGDRGNEVGALLSPHVKAAMEIKLNATSAHLYFEEIMMGDAGEDVANVWAYLDTAEAYLAAIEQGDDIAGAVYFASEDPAVQAAGPKVLQSLVDFRTAAEQRYANLGKGDEGAGSAADAAFDAAYDSVIVEATALEKSVFEDMQEGLTRLAGAQSFAIITLILAGVGAASGCFTVFLFFRKVVSARLDQLVTITGELAKGNTEVDIPVQKVQDELTVMFDAFTSFRGALIEQAALENADKQRNAESGQRRRASDRLTDDLKDTIHAVMAGELSRRVAADYSQEELKSLAAEVNALLDAVDKGLTDTGHVLSALAKADLSQRVTGKFQGAFAELQDNTNAVADRLTDVMGRLQETSHRLKTATGEILAGSNDLAERTSRQAAMVQQTTSTVSSLSSTVTENAHRAQEADRSVGNASRIAVESGSAMEAANKAMEQISTSSSKISNIIGMIDDIAFQTNLLALNASVEAARAGEAGKGFAVVAVEVRRLAQSAAEASAEIKQLIEISAGEVQAGTQVVMQIAGQISTLNLSVRESAKLIGEIAEASRSQAIAIGEVSTAVRQMDEITQHNAALVEETNAAIEQTENQAAELDEIVAVFELGAARVQARYAA